MNLEEFVSTPFHEASPTGGLVRYYYGFLDLLTQLCFDRNYRAINALEKLYPYKARTQAPSAHCGKAWDCHSPRSIFLEK